MKDLTNPNVTIVHAIVDGRHLKPYINQCLQCGEIVPHFSCGNLDEDCEMQDGSRPGPCCAYDAGLDISDVHTCTRSPDQNLELQIKANL